LGGVRACARKDGGELVELTLARQLAVRIDDDVVGRLEFLDRLRCLARLDPKLCDPLLHPVAGALHYLQLGCELVLDVGLSNPVRDVRGLLRVERGERNLGDEAAPEPEHPQPALECGQRHAPVLFPHRGGT
jgi:hypothetical protein